VTRQMVDQLPPPQPTPGWRPSLTELFLYFVAVMVAVPGYPSLYKFACLGIIVLIIRAVRRHHRKGVSHDH